VAKKRHDPQGTKNVRGVVGGERKKDALGESGILRGPLAPEHCVRGHGEKASGEALHIKRVQGESLGGWGGVTADLERELKNDIRGKSENKANPGQLATALPTAVCGKKKRKKK